MSERRHLEIRTLRKSGQTDDAYTLGRELLRENPDDLYVKGELGWVLFDKIKAIAIRAKADRSAQNEASRHEVYQLLREYGSLKLRPPDLLFSRILFWVLQFPAEFTFLPKFMKWAGADCFLPDDFRRDPSEGGRGFPSLVEKVAHKVAKVAREHDDAEQMEFAIKLIDRAFSECDVQEPVWLRYNKGLILTRLGLDKAEAQSLLKLVVQEKPKEAWAWHALGKATCAQNTGLALRIHARAWLVGRHNPEFSVKIIEDLCAIAATSHQFELAKWAASEAIAIRRAAGTKMQPFMQSLLNSDWFAQTDGVANPEPILLELAADAELELFYGDPFRCDASFIDTYVDHSGEPAVNLVVRSGVKAEEIRARLHGQISVQLLGPGSAVEAVIFDGPDASICSEIVARSEGMPFDCLDRIIGTIDRHDEANGRASVNTEATRFCTLSYRRFPEVKTWEPGTHVAIQGAWLGDHLKPYRVQLADALSTSS